MRHCLLLASPGVSRQGEDVGNAALLRFPSDWGWEDQAEGENNYFLEFSVCDLISNSIFSMYPPAYRNYC